MKLSVQENLVPGRTLAEKLDKTAAYGFDGIEVHGSHLSDRFDAVAHAFENHSINVSTICAGFRGCLLDADRKQRDLAASDIMRVLEMGGALGAVGLIVVPVFGPPKLPDLSPHKTAVELELDLLIDLLGPLAEAAAKAECLILVEPLNRYETHLLRRLDQAVKVVNRVKRKGCAILADFFHMSVEEDDIADAIRAAGRHIRHVHLADSQRLQPGTGHTDFRAAFRALKDVGFKDYAALECGIRGRPAAALPNCVKFLRRQMR